MTEQEKEIATIKPRHITVNLSDADVKRIAEKAGASGMTIGTLLENFIGDLICGTYSNGSDERMFANEYFDRCWFSWSNSNFLSYLIDSDEIFNPNKRELFEEYKVHRPDADYDEEMKLVRAWLKEYEEANR